jgi:hypothetical protein
MLALYFKCMMMNLAWPSLFILSTIALLLYIYKRVYTLSFAIHVWDGNMVLGVCGVKTGRRRRFGYFCGGELETTDLGSGDGGALLSVPPLLWFLEHRCWGFFEKRLPQLL